ncbi:DUF3150 domain-containing protein [Geoalkalibacter subterraneus]|uniref:DUF3150 domain-containing protein n=1 Tax=Geoalkalibacter subterraneus TaxID=483547 RepID=UPI000694C4A6|nr:DUF3150 domain-containing protein [Geoalkalibacter subterraneus]
MQQKVLEKVICVFLDVHLWTGRKKLRPEDLKVTAGEIPPDKLASLGSKKICDHSELSVFSSLKKRAERECEKVGVRFLGGYAVPEDQAENLATELASIQGEFEVAKKKFVGQYDQAIEAWIADNGEWGSIIRGAVEPVSTVKRQLRFAYQAFKIASAGDDCGSLNSGLDNKVGSLGDRLIFEVSRDAERAWENSFRGKDRVTQKALRPIRALIEKLKGLSFLDGKIGRLVTRLETGLAALPQNGPIEGQDLNALVGLVLMLADPEATKGLAADDWGAQPEEEEDIDQEVEEASETSVEVPGVQEPVSETPAAETEEEDEEEVEEDVVIDYDDADPAPADEAPAFPVNWF